MIYEGHCHCGAVQFRIRCDELESAVRCNCSICVRKGAVMSARYFAPEEFEVLSGLEALAVYRFGDNLVNHYFCRTCGVYPFHDVTLTPGHYRVNLGCLDAVDPFALRVAVIDGKSF